MRNYFIGWCVSYFLEAIAPFICLISIKKGSFYVFCYVALSIVFLCKIAVIVSLVWKVWRGIGACYIPDDFESFILIVNIFELLAIGVLFTLIWRIKLVQKELALTSKWRMIPSALISTLIKEFELVMSDIFQVIPQSAPTLHRPSQISPNTAYIRLQGDFLTHNFGHYSLRFIEMICQDA